MKRQGCILHRVTLAVFVLLAVGIGHAQYQIRATIPFNFTIGNHSYPAGEYTFGSVPYSHRTLILLNQTGPGPAYIQTDSADIRETPTSTKLVFNRYGGRYFLSQIWREGSQFGQQLKKSSAEIEMARIEDSPAQLVAINVVPHR
ncbi:MAG: hypothetical protein WB919_24120 [Candidatus Sulfotelmatobacter sp.]